MKIFRKEPVQERSRHLVDSIFEGASIALSQFGMDKVSTTKIAQKAGVSVGSLYQFFPGKKNIISGYFKIQLNRQHKLFMEKVEELSVKPVDEFIRSFTQFVFIYLQERKDKVQYIYKYAAVLDQYDEMMALRQEMIESLADYLDTRRDEIKDINSHRAATILVHGSMGIFSNTLFHSEKEILCEETISLISRHILKYSDSK